MRKEHLHESQNETLFPAFEAAKWLIQPSRQRGAVRASGRWLGLARLLRPHQRLVGLVPDGGFKWRVFDIGHLRIRD